MFLNKAIIIGNITRDPEIKALPSGMTVCSFSVATNRTWKDKDGSKKEAVEFHNIQVFGRTAENVAKFMRKGSQIMIEGRIQTRSWETKEKTKAYRTEIVAENVQFGTSPKRDDRSDDQKAGEPEAVAGEEINAEDIPF